MLITSQLHRHARQDLDLPFLSATKPIPAALQGHHSHQPPARALAQVHHDRVHALSTGSGSPDLHLCH